MIFPPD